MNQKGFTLTEMMFFMLMVFGSCGWVWNIVKICEYNFDHITTVIIFRVIGVIVVPIGAVVGYI